MEKLSDIRKELNNLNEVLGVDTTNWNPQTLPGILGKQNSARQKIVTVKERLARAILLNSATILVDRTFEGTGEIVTSAQKNTSKNILLDFLALEKDFFTKIFTKKTQSLSFNSEIISRINILMFDIGKLIGAESMPGVTASSNINGTVKTRAEMISKIEKILEASYGFELKQHYMRAMLQQQIETRLDQDSVNVVVVNVPENFLQALRIFTKKNTVINNESQLANSEEKPTPRRRTPRVKNTETQETVEQTDKE